MGVHPLVSQNDSADDLAKKVMETLPERMAKCIKHVEATPAGSGLLSTPEPLTILRLN